MRPAHKGQKESPPARQRCARKAILFFHRFCSSLPIFVFNFPIFGDFLGGDGCRQEQRMNE